MLENSDGAITIEQSRETGNIGYTRWEKQNKAQSVLDTTIRKQTQIM
jgi:hypothetical protein